jgi:hypothetical protein
MDDSGQLTPNEELFAFEYLTDRNGTRAYRASHPRCSSDNAAAVEACRLLRKPKVSSFIKQEMDARLERLQLDGDEALATITRNAQADMRRFFDSQGRLLPVHLWPDDVGDSVKSLRYKSGRVVGIVMHDKLKALELMAIASGKLKQRRPQPIQFDHASLLGPEPPLDDD